MSFPKYLVYTETGRMIIYCVGKEVVTRLFDNDIKGAVSFQSKSGATFSGKKRWNNIRAERYIKDGNCKQKFRCYAARTFYYLLRRAQREYQSKVGI
jgi:hypothetical protein